MSETNGIDRKRTMEAASNNTWESKAATKRALPKAPPKMTVTYVRNEKEYYPSINLSVLACLLQ